MKKIVLSGFASALMLAACKKENPTATATPSLEQQKIEYQQRQLEIEKQKLAIEQEKLQFETQKKADSIAKIQSGTQKTTVVKEVPSTPKVVTRTKTVYRDRPVRHTSSSSPKTYASTGSAASSGSSAGSYPAESYPATTQSSPRRQGMSKTAKGAIIGTAGGAAVGAIVAKKNRGLGAVIGGIVGGATGYTVGRSKDKQDGRIP